MERLLLRALSICFVLTLVLAIGCGSNLDKEMADAEAALQAAKDAGAEGLPEYQAAEELIEKAKEMMAAGNKDAARQLLHQEGGEGSQGLEDTRPGPRRHHHRRSGARNRAGENGRSERQRHRSGDEDHRRFRPFDGHHRGGHVTWPARASA